MADPRRPLQTARISRATQWTAVVIGGFRLNRLEVHAALLMEVQVTKVGECENSWKTDLTVN